MMRFRTIAKLADDYEPTERIKKIAQLFSTFRNSDKETILTPWRVVNMHMSDTIGGYDFYDEEHKQEIEVPRFVNQKDVTDKIFTDDGKVLEINSKIGLYPLYVAYTFYRQKLGNKELTLEEKPRRKTACSPTSTFESKTVTLTKGFSFFTTSILIESVFPFSSVAVSKAVPSCKAKTTPFSSTLTELEST